MTLSRRALTLALGSTALAGWPAVSTAAVSPQDRTLGNPKAKVTVYEYASVTCPHCGRWNQDVWPAFRLKYVDTGLVLFVLRELPTEPAVVATGGFLVARCATPAHYFTVIDALFAGQQELFQSGDFQGWLVQAGAAGGLSRERVLACAQDESAMAALNARIDASLRQHRVGVTPTFFINDVTLQGEQSLAQLDAVIQPMLRGQR